MGKKEVIEELESDQDQFEDGFSDESENSGNEGAPTTVKMSDAKKRYEKPTAVTAAKKTSKKSKAIKKGKQSA